MNTPCVAFGAFPLKGDSACGPAKPVPRHFWNRSSRSSRFAAAAGAMQ